MPNLLLRLEGTAILAAALITYSQMHYSWWLFALFLLTPDLAALGYLINKSVGSLSYNLMHTYILPIGLGLAALSFNFDPGLQLAIIWLAHIGMDRLFGYGLKYPDDFKHTHFSKI
ncbi:MAG: DUF4260 domain-containing protein [Chloroflexi bacterium]|nr:DUF4260 domain-containing protein [Chloroflexota bacterium]